MSLSQRFTDSGADGGRGDSRWRIRGPSTTSGGAGGRGGTPAVSASGRWPPGWSAGTGREVAAARAAVATTDRYASEVGLRVLRRGGNAVDAAVASAFALAVVNPEAGNLGGGGFLVVRRPAGSLLALDFRVAGARRRGPHDVHQTRCGQERGVPARAPQRGRTRVGRRVLGSAPEAGEHGVERARRAGRAARPGLPGREAVRAVLPREDRRGTQAVSPLGKRLPPRRERGPAGAAASRPALLPARTCPDPRADPRPRCGWLLPGGDREVHRGGDALGWRDHHADGPGVL